MKNIEEATISDLQIALEKKKITSYELIQLYMERIATFDRQGPRLNSVLELNPDALALSEAADAERRQGLLRGPLHGIPILLKDNIDTADRMHTSAGSLALAGHYAAQDAFLVRKLRKAGAIILGKANMTEWANYMAEGMTAGYSSRGGQVLNPYGQSFFAGGSSTGSGVAVAAGFAAAAVGTETSGSILSPATQNSIVGIKPTVGRISRSGVIPLAHSQDTAGPMARTVADAAILFAALCGVDANDPITGSSIAHPLTDLRGWFDRDGLQGARIGVPRKIYHDKLSEEERALFDSLLQEMASAGAVIVDPADIATAEELNSYRSEVFRYEFKADLNFYLQRVSPKLPVHSLQELIAFNEADPVNMLKYGQSILKWSEETSGTLTEPRYIEDRLKDIRLSREEGIDLVLRQHSLDALLFPKSTGAGIAAKAGYPSIAVPGGYLKDGMPFGITFTGGAFTEPALIRLAYAFEQLRARRKAPVLDKA
ncbi:amidase family protein [Paenibacillus turpanensis]|uniref:amidase family protein n=1 Tax=Paenibacillus turpanensis TaxID=2689078 RepID=UPI00140E296E|nr:amidase family protein [Paenibacillus turpanensis]